MGVQDDQFKTLDARLIDLQAKVNQLLREQAIVKALNNIAAAIAATGTGSPEQVQKIVDAINADTQALKQAINNQGE